jgi:hypothetical protein
VQQRQHTPSESESSLSALPSSASRGSRSSRLVGLVAAAGAVVLALLGTGCPQPADLETPEVYCKPGESIVDMTTGLVTGCKSGGSGGTAAGGTAAGGTAAGGTAAGGTGSADLSKCEVACMATVLTKCTICHGNGALKYSDLDLQTPGYSARLKDKPAVHKDINGMAIATCASGDLLVNSQAPMDSWFLKKVASQDGECGDPMPQGTGLMGDELTCVQTYVSCVAGAM